MLAACGGGGDATTDSTQGTPLTKDEFLAQGNQICKSGNEAVSSAASSLGQNPSQADIDQFVNDTLIPTVEGELNSLQALGAPSGDEDQVNAIIDAAQSGVDSSSANPGEATNPNSPAFQEANKLASAYGLTDCGSG